MPDNTFRVQSVLGAFDLEIDHATEHFKGNIDIEDLDWNVGLIVGGSGTGKSTIAKQVFSDAYFSDYEYNAKSVIDDMPKSKSIKDIEKVFTSVGFASPPSWLKPYSVLSNGEKMRVDLARNILDDKELIVFDEFTSVVNREVAKTSSYAISKAVKKQNKKFIAISCHSDVIEWLEPDWIYNTDEKCFFCTKGKINRPAIELQIYRVDNKIKSQVWQLFRKYHYLNTDLHKACEQYVGVINDQIVCHTGVIHFPMKKGAKRVHRLVVLPDYQGIGIGSKFIKEVAKMVSDNGYEFNLTTTTPALIWSLINDKDWCLARYGRASAMTGFNRYKGARLKHLTNATSQKRITYSFWYKGGVNNSKKK